MGFIRDWKISLVVLAFVPFLALAGAGMKLVLSDSAKKESDAYARAGEIASETIGSIRTVQAYCAEEAEVKRYDKNLVKAEKMGRFKGMMQGISMGGMWLAMLTTYGE
jgi:ABC-type multidrug transport system fused ATPase/permease subunit